MSIGAVGLKAYTTALNNFAKAEKAAGAGSIQTQQQPVSSFGNMLSESLGKVNELQKDKSHMITTFASGENQNVHELMISMQKAGLAMNVTTAVRNKVMEAYRELSRMQF